MKRYKQLFESTLEEAKKDGETWKTKSGFHAGKYNGKIQYFNKETFAKEYASSGTGAKNDKPKSNAIKGIDNDLQDFASIALKYDDPEKSFDEVRKIRTVSADTSEKFRQIYGSHGERGPEAWAAFVKDVREKAGKKEEPKSNKSKSDYDTELVKDRPNNQLWKVKKGKDSYSVNKTEHGWRIAKKGENSLAVLGSKFANSPEEAIDIYEANKEEQKM